MHPIVQYLQQVKTVSCNFGFSWRFEDIIYHSLHVHIVNGYVDTKLYPWFNLNATEYECTNDCSLIQWDEMVSTSPRIVNDHADVKFSHCAQFSLFACSCYTELHWT